jgi:hypothetical protein
VSASVRVQKVSADICKTRSRSRAVRRASRRARDRAAQLRAAQKQPLVEETEKVEIGFPEPESQLIFLDWDDTVLPTSFLAGHQIGLDSVLPEALAESFEEYAKVVRVTLQVLKLYGRVMIVTNAETGWVELTCAKFLPGLLPEVAELPRVSARSEYEPRGFLGPAAWKTEAFAVQMQRHFGDAEPNVLSVGDANHERIAVQRAAKRFDVEAKSIKFIEKPDLEMLSREHTLLQEHFSHLQSVDSLDVRLDDI